MAKKIQKRTREAFIFSLKGKYIPDSVIDVMNIILKAPAYFFKRAGGLYLPGILPCGRFRKSIYNAIKNAND